MYKRFYIIPDTMQYQANNYASNNHNIIQIKSIN